MELSNLIKGKYYYTNSSNNKNIHIFQFDRIDSGCIITKSGTIRYGGSFDNSHIIFGTEYLLNLREATDKEIAWLETCIKHNRFIPLSEVKSNEIINDYQIF